MGRVVLVTGVADPLGARAARRLVDDPEVDGSSASTCCPRAATSAASASSAPTSATP